MNIEEVITKLNTVDKPFNMMNLRFIMKDGEVCFYEGTDCWGDFLGEYSCPSYINIPLLVDHHDVFIEWAMNTPLLSEVLMNETVECVRNNGWILKTENYWSKWYTAGMFCRTFSEQFESKIPYEEGVPASVLYWCHFMHINSSIVPYKHGSFFGNDINYKKMFNLPKAKLNDKENKDCVFYTRVNEVHSEQYIRPKKDDCILHRSSSLRDESTRPSWEGENSTRIPQIRKKIKSFLLEIYKEC